MIVAMQSVYEAAGGAAGLRRLAEAWHVRCLADPVVEHAFSHGFRPDHTERLAAYWSEALGGPADFTAVRGDVGAVERMHACEGEHAEMDSHALACFDEALHDTGLDADERLAAVLHDYFERSTAALTRWPGADEVATGGRPVPRWGWDGPLS